MGKRRILQTDLNVAQRLKAARKSAGLSMEAAAEACDLTFQQIQKYENGSNRIAVGRIVVLCKLYGITIASLFHDIDTISSTNDDLGAAILSAPGGAELARAFIKIYDAPKRRLVVDLAQCLAA